MIGSSFFQGNAYINLFGKPRKKDIVCIRFTFSGYAPIIRLLWALQWKFIFHKKKNVYKNLKDFISQLHLLIIADSIS
jgi:hypothetical protein